MLLIDRRKLLVAFATIAASPFFALKRAYAIAISCNASSGQPHIVKSFPPIDSSGKQWPVTIKYTTLPKSGIARTEFTSAEKASLSGQVKSVRVAQVVYQSKKGFVGYDNFTFLRITSDPNDSRNNSEYTVAVTVR